MDPNPNPLTSPPVSDVPPWPQVDFAAFGEIETVPVSRTQKLTAGFLTRNWTMIPHVTHHDEADLTRVEVLRRQLAETSGTKLTLLPFVLKAIVAGLREFPRFNASLSADGKQLVLKKYFHIGVAVDTPNGLLVPVLLDCDQKSVAELAQEIAAVAHKARTKGLSMTEMSGGSFSVSALGAFGGTGFTPIINAPEVAILGLARIQQKPFPDAADAGARAEGTGIGGGVVWKPMLPLSLSYDHRVINGAEAARFTSRVATLIAGIDVLLQDPAAQG